MYKSVREFDPSPGGPDLKPFVPVKGQELASLVGHRDAVQDLPFTPDGRMLLSRADDGTVKLWDVAKREGRATLAVESSLITAWDLAPDGKRLATGSLHSTPPHTAEIRLWDLESGRPLEVVAGTKTWIQSLKFSADGRSLASTENGSLRFSVETQTLISAENENVLRFWDATTLASLEAVGTSEKLPLALERPAAGPTLAVVSHLGTAELWGFDTRKRRATLRYNDVDQDLRPFVARFSPDGKVLATGSAKPHEVVDRRRYLSGVVKLFDVATGREEATLLGQDGPIGCLAFTPDGETLASSSPFNSLVLWDVPGRALKAKLSGHKDKVLAIAFSPDGQMLASVSSDRTLRLWNAQSGKAQTVYVGHTDDIRTLAFSPDGALIATGGSDRTVKLWNARPSPAKKR